MEYGRLRGDILEGLRRGWWARRRRAPYIYLVGPDGCGKSMLATGLSETVGAWHRYWRPGLLPLPRTLVGNAPSGEVNSSPHALRQNSTLRAYLRIGYYLADFVLGYWLLVHPRLLRGRVVVCERGWLDFLVDPTRYGLADRLVVLRLITKLVPRPDVLCIVEVVPETVQSRKNELSVQEIARQYHAWRTLEIGHRSKLYFDNNGDADDVIDRLSRTLGSVGVQ